jgi:hypothetical protein
MRARPRVCGRAAVVSGKGTWRGNTVASQSDRAQGPQTAGRSLEAGAGPLLLRHAAQHPTNFVIRFSSPSGAKGCRRNRRRHQELTAANVRARRDAIERCKNNLAHNVGNCCLNFRHSCNQQKIARNESASFVSAADEKKDGQWLRSRLWIQRRSTSFPRAAARAPIARPREAPRVLPRQRSSGPSMAAPGTTKPPSRMPSPRPRLRDPSTS